MTTPFRFAGSFQVRHPIMGSDAICKALAMKPTQSWNAGDQKVTPKGTRLGGNPSGNLLFLQNWVRR